MRKNDLNKDLKEVMGTASGSLRKSTAGRGTVNAKGLYRAGVGTVKE